MDILSRQIPFNLEAEQSVLGSIRVDPQKYDTIAESGLKGSDFYLD